MTRHLLINTKSFGNVYGTNGTHFRTCCYWKIVSSEVTLIGPHLPHAFFFVSLCFSVTPSLSLLLSFSIIFFLGLSFIAPVCSLFFFSICHLSWPSESWQVFTKPVSAGVGKCFLESNKRI